MFCVYCGTQLPEYANFCSHCGKKVETLRSAEEQKPSVKVKTPPAFAECEIVYVSVQEKIGLFPKEKGRFEVIADSGGERQVLASSPVFELDGFNLYGPQEKNARHRQPLEELADALEQDGWVRRKKKGSIWYNYKFERPEGKE